MKICPKCNAQTSDEAVFCTNCGNSFQPMNQPNQQSYQQPNNQQPNNGYYNQQAPNQQVPNNPTYAQPVANVYDHTAEFDVKDVHENKIFALLIYLSSILGIAIALLAKKDSPYLSFHIKQGLKIFVTEALVTLLTVLLFWTCIAAVAGVVLLVIIAVVNIIAFVNTCLNKSVEVPIIRSLKFLN